MNQKETAIEFIERRTFKAEDSNPSLKMVAVNDVLEAINIASEPGWIEVSEDNLPEIGWYIGHIAGGNVDMVYFKGKYFVFEPYGNAADVTHYLPTITLPEPKKKA